MKYLTIKKMRNILYNHLAQEADPKKIVRSLCVGAYIAFCPFIGLHTVLVILLSWCFGLNYLITFLASNIINNPWTLVPIYALDYTAGMYVCKAAGIDALRWNPLLMTTLNQMITRVTGINSLSVTAFLLGGNLLALALGGILYPILLLTVTRYRSNHQVPS